MKRLLGGAVIVVAVVIAVSGLLAWRAWQGFNAPGPLAAPVTLVVPRHSGVTAIAQQLVAAGVVADANVFAVVAKLDGGSLKAGEYAFAAGISGQQVLQTMRRGDTVVRKLTVAEGLTSRQVMAVILAAEGLDGDSAEIPSEGSLLPETYHYSWGDSRKGLVERMRRAMQQTLDGLWSARESGLPLRSRDEAVTLASIVERETALADERPRVAAVFYNRLRQGMKLQSDPTVIYALSHGLGVLDHTLGHDDLAVASPYNTYLNTGLPPGPIANPGKASLAAVLHPAPVSDLYFVADGSGGHVFSRTLAEHNHNVARWRQLQDGR